MSEVSGSLHRHPQKRGDVWQARLRIDGRAKKVNLGKCWDEKGRPYDGYLTEKKATEKFNDLLADIRNGRAVFQTKKTGRTLENAAEEWLRYLTEDKGRKDSTVGSYRRLLPRIYRTFVADTAVEKISTAKIEAFRKELAADGLSSSTLSHYMHALNGIFKRARKTMGLKVNPMDDIEWTPPKYNGQYDVYTYEEIVRLSEAATNQFYATFFLLAGLCGLRLGELRALTWRDVRYEQKTINVLYNYPVCLASLPPEEERKKYTPKSGKARSVPLPKQCIQPLKELRLQSRFSADDDLVFASPLDGNLLAYSPLLRAFHRARRKAELPRRRLHDLRHSAATIFAETFPNAFKVQDILGHADIATTRKYIHMRPKDEDADLLSDALERRTKKPKGRRAA